MKETLDKAIKGEITWENYIIEDGWWHYSKEPFKDYRIEHAVIETADFGKLCDYQNVLVGLRLILKEESGFSVGWSFESMKDIQILFNKTKVTYLKELVGTPMLLAISGQRIVGCKVNEALVVKEEH